MVFGKFVGPLHALAGALAEVCADAFHLRGVLRHGLIGPGVYASHGYERSHKDGVENTLKLLAAYIG